MDKRKDSRINNNNNDNLIETIVYFDNNSPTSHVNQSKIKTEMNDFSLLNRTQINKSTLFEDSNEINEPVDEHIFINDNQLGVQKYDIKYATFDDPYINPLDLRTDKGALWENFLISERLKMQQYNHIYTNNYFWRTVQKQEIDFVQESNGQLTAYEFKWKRKGSVKIPSTFLREYDAIGNVIDKDNFREFVRNTQL